MFGVSPVELAIILVAALIVLGPKRLPELARTLGKFMREFRRQTDDVKNIVEREFYKMDQELDLDKPLQPPPAALPPPGAVPALPDPGHDEFGRLLSPPPAAAAAEGVNVIAPPENAAAPTNGAAAPPDLDGGAHPAMPLPAPPAPDPKAGDQ